MNRITCGRATPRDGRSRTIGLGLALVVVVGALAGCFGRPTSDLSGSYLQAGSSTVLPIAEVWGEEFNAMHPGVTFAVSGGGSGTGANKLCRGEVQIGDLSRPMKDSEKQECAKNGIDPFEIRVAIDGLAVVVSKKNTFVDHLTVDELHRIWTADASKQANRWSELREGWPDQEINLYGPGTNSGTFDYFVEVVIHPKDGTTTKGRSDYTPSEDDNRLVQGIQDDPHALAYFGLAYVKHNEGVIRAVKIDEGRGKGPVEPTPSNVESGTYTPLARPIFMYTNGPPTGALKEYFLWGLGDEGQSHVEGVGYVKLPAAMRTEMLDKINGG